MYIICAVITIPVGLVGRFIIPGTIELPNRWVLNDTDLKIAQKRLEKKGHRTQGKLKLHHIKEIFLSKYFYIVLFVDILFWNAGANSGAFLLWLKSLKRYNSAKVNQFGTIPSGLGIFYTLFANFSSDLLWGPAWSITFASGYNAVALLLLVRLAAHFYGAILYTYSNEFRSSGTFQRAENGSLSAVPPGHTPYPVCFTAG